MSKVQSFLESYSNIREYCLIWAQLSSGNTTVSNIYINFDKVSFSSQPCTSGIGAYESFDANLIEKYPNLEDFRNYCVDYFDKKKKAEKDEMTRINELKDLVVNSDNYKELAALAQKKGNYIEFDIRNLNFRFTGTSYPAVDLSYGGSGRVTSCSINPIPFFGIIN
jgi:hypothetical protein